MQLKLKHGDLPSSSIFDILSRLPLDLFLVVELHSFLLSSANLVSLFTKYKSPFMFGELAIMLCVTMMHCQKRLVHSLLLN